MTRASAWCTGGYDVDLVIFCTWEYEYMIPPHAALLDKYGPGMGMIVYGDRQTGDLPANVEFRRAPHLDPGQDWDWAEDDWGPRGGFGVGFMACMEEMARDVVLFTFPDMWPASHIYQDRLDDLADYVRAHGNLMRLQVAQEVGTADVGAGRTLEQWRGCDIATVPATDQHCGNRGGFHWDPSLWNVPLLMGFMEPWVSHWGFEAVHQVKMETRPDLMSCWSRQMAYGLHHVHDRHEPGLELYKYPLEDRALIKSALRPGTYICEDKRTWTQI